VKCSEILEEPALARMNKRRSGDFLKAIGAISLHGSQEEELAA